MSPKSVSAAWGDDMHQAKILARLIDLQPKKIKRNCFTDQ